GAPPSSDKPAFVVWGNHPAAVSRIIELIQQAGYPIVERSRLDAIFDEQKTRLMHTSEDMPALLRVGQLVGAGRIAFVEAQQRSDTRSGTISTPGAIVPMGNVWITTPPTSESYSVTLYHVSVAVRAVNVEDGTIRWSGTAAYNKPINNPEFALGLLAEGAFRRAVCPIEKGYRWIEQGPWRNKYGCLPPQE
ncbi:MAG: CsgG/HfaB family protein, partial [Terriglobia bacterium]